LNVFARTAQNTHSERSQGDMQETRIVRWTRIVGILLLTNGILRSALYLACFGITGNPQWPRPPHWAILPLMSVKTLQACCLVVIMARRRWAFSLFYALCGGVAFLHFASGAPVTKWPISLLPIVIIMSLSRLGRQTKKQKYCEQPDAEVQSEGAPSD
jgi:hypothetical protein